MIKPRNNVSRVTTFKTIQIPECPSLSNKHAQTLAGCQQQRLYKDFCAVNSKVIQGGQQKMRPLWELHYLSGFLCKDSTIYKDWSFLPAGDTETWAVFHAVAPLSVPPLNSTSLHQSLCCCTTTNLQNLKASTWEELSWKNAFQSMHVNLTVYFALSLVECHPRHLMWDPTCRLYFETMLPTIAQGFPTVNRNK